MNRATHEMLSRLELAGIRYSDAAALRRAAMTLHRWFELECGDDSNQWGSVSLERDEIARPAAAPFSRRPGAETEEE